MSEIEALAGRGELSDSGLLELTGYRQLESRVVSLEAYVAELRERLESHSGELSGFGTPEQMIGQLVRDIAATSTAYTTALARLQDTQTIRELALLPTSQPIVTVLPPRVDGDGKIGLLAAVSGGIVGGLLVCLLLILVFEVFDPTVRLPEEAADIAGLDVILELPSLPC